jgi:hypothetical protein
MPAAQCRHPDLKKAPAIPLPAGEKPANHPDRAALGCKKGYPDQTLTSRVRPLPAWLGSGNSERYLAGTAAEWQRICADRNSAARGRMMGSDFGAKMA